MPSTEAVATLRRRFDAPPERVFDAWTNPEVMRRWWAAGEGWDTPVAEVDLRPGGRFRVAMHNPETGGRYAASGTYTVVERPQRLAFTWQWEDPGSAETTVTVAFSADGTGTEVVLTHSGLADEADRANHTQGWTGCLNNLERRVLGA
jgi:glutathione S-transferase